MGEDSVSAPGQLQRGGVFPPEGPLGSPPPHRCTPACLVSSPHETKIVWVVRWHGGSSQRSLSHGDSKVTRLLEPSTHLLSLSDAFLPGCLGCLLSKNEEKDQLQCGLGSQARGAVKMVSFGGSDPRSQLLRCPTQNFLCSWFSISGRSTPVFFLGLEWGGPSWPDRTERLVGQGGVTSSHVALSCRTLPVTLV